MLTGMAIGFGSCLVVFLIFLAVFHKRLREMREKENSIYKRLFKK